MTFQIRVNDKIFTVHTDVGGEEVTRIRFVPVPCEEAPKPVAEPEVSS